MDGIGVLQALARRWLLTIPLLLITAYLAAQAYSGAAPSYHATGNLLFVGPNTTLNYLGDEVFAVPQNPLINVSGADIAAVSTSHAMLDDDVARSLSEAGLTASYGVNIDRRSPIMQISVSSPVAGDALMALDLLVERARVSLEERQDELGAPEENRLAFQLLSFPSSERIDNSAKLKQGMIVLAVGLVLTTVIVVAFDVAMRRRRARKSARNDTNASAPEPTDVAAPEQTDVAGDAEPTDPRAPSTLEDRSVESAGGATAERSTSHEPSIDRTDATITDGETSRDTAVVADRSSR